MTNIGKQSLVHSTTRVTRRSRRAGLINEGREGDATPIGKADFTEDDEWRSLQWTGLLFARGDNLGPVIRRMNGGRPDRGSPQRQAAVSMIREKRGSIQS